jgi:hypothetical protein
MLPSKKALMKRSPSPVSGRLWCASDSHLAEKEFVATDLHAAWAFNQLFASYLHAARVSNQFVATNHLNAEFLASYVMSGTYSPPLVP